MKLAAYKAKKWFQTKDPILIKEIDLKNGNTGWLVIDSMGYGVSAGGVRIGKNVNLREIKLLASEMSSKRLFYNDPVGGGKAGICCSGTLSQSEMDQIFLKFGESIKAILYEGYFYPGTDMGTNHKNIELIYKGAGIKNKNEDIKIDSSYYTAISVFSSLRAVTSFQGKTLPGSRIGIQGLGNVGLKLLQLAFEHGMKLVATSTQHGALYSPEGLDVREIFDLVKSHGDKFVFYYDREKRILLDDFFEKDMDIMCPCAGIYPINEGNLKQIKAKTIIPGCNVAANEKIEKQLYDRGIAYLPGFVCNAGGILGYKLQRYDIETEVLSRGIESRVKNLLEQADKSGRSPTDIARSIVRRNRIEFTLEADAKSKGKIAWFVNQISSAGASGILYTFLWKLSARKLIVPNLIRKYLIKKIFFFRIFRSIPVQ